MTSSQQGEPSEAGQTLRALLSSWEDRADYPRYGDKTLSLPTDGRDVFVVSDLHIAAGKTADGTCVGTENFFADAAFARWLEHSHNQMENGRLCTLVINGDFIDFMRIMDVPRTDEDFEAWCSILEPLGGEILSARQLKEKIIEKELVHGLRTNDFKSVWKLAAAVTGHPQLFTALATWVQKGHRLVIVKGNHDVDWYWQLVRNYMRLALASRLGGDVLFNLQQLLPRVFFADDAAVIGDVLYIEHGHRFEPVTAVRGGPVRKGGNELNIPFGSFFNRYLINHVELHYPFINNVRPHTDILPMLIRERFPLALKLFFHHGMFMIRIIPKRHWRYFIVKALPLFLALVLPALAVVLFLRDDVTALANSIAANGLFSGPFGFVAERGLGVLGDFAWLVASYVLSQLVAAAQLTKPSTLEGRAREILRANDRYRYVVFGHTHDPRQSARDGRWYYNAGTWIPVIEASASSVRYDRTFTYLHMPTDGGEALKPGAIYRWFDEAGRAEPAAIVKRKHR